MGRPSKEQQRIKELEGALGDAIGEMATALERGEVTFRGPVVQDLAYYLPVPEDEYTAKEREDAALICDMVAASYAPFDQGAAPDGHEPVCEEEAAAAIGASTKSTRLARDTQDVVMDLVDEPTDFIAESAAWIRSGWSPGDEWSLLDPIGPATEIQDPVPGVEYPEPGEADIGGSSRFVEPTDAELLAEHDDTDPTADMIALENAALAEVAAGDEDESTDALDVATEIMAEPDAVYSDA